MNQLEYSEWSQSVCIDYSIHTSRTNTYVFLVIQKFSASFGDNSASLIELLVPSVGIWTLVLINWLGITGISRQQCQLFLSKQGMFGRQKCLRLKFMVLVIWLKCWFSLEQLRSCSLEHWRSCSDTRFTLVRSYSTK